MRPEKQNLTKEYLVRLNGSPFFIVVNYQGLKVSHLTQLRKRLNTASSAALLAQKYALDVGLNFCIFS